MTERRPLISIITPTFDEAANAERCRAAVAAVMAPLGDRYDFEHIFADNGSTDGTREILRTMADAHPEVRVILNSRNFGAEASILNAVRRCHGDAAVVMIPADLQDPPELIPQFLEQWERGYRIVAGQRGDREESFVMRKLRRLFYRLVTATAECPIPPYVGDFQLLDRKVIDSLKLMKDNSPYLRGLVAATGFSRVEIPYVPHNREAGKSKMSFAPLFSYALNGIVSFSRAPLRLCLVAGMIIAAVSVLYALFAFVVGLVYYRSIAAPGVMTVIVSLFFFGGVQMFFLGVLGEYIGAIHTQVRGRPLVIEDELINFDAARTTPHESDPRSPVHPDPGVGVQ